MKKQVCLRDKHGGLFWGYIYPLDVIRKQVMWLVVQVSLYVIRMVSVLYLKVISCQEFRMRVMMLK